MLTCNELDRLATPYLDGEVVPADREAVDSHLSACPPCRTRVEAEAAARALLHARRARLGSLAAPAPPALRARCAGAAPVAPVDTVRGAARWRRAVPLSLAATLILLVGAYVLYAASRRSDTLFAAELTLDHMKCFALQQAGVPSIDLSAVDHVLDASFGWTAGAPGGGEAAPIQLVGARRCFYADGRVAHLLYRHDGQPVSLFLVPDGARAARLLRVMGHEALIWPERDWTCVLIARAPPREMEKIATYVRASLDQ